MYTHNHIHIFAFLVGMCLLTIPELMFAQNRSAKHCGFNSWMGEWEDQAPQQFLRTRSQQESTYIQYLYDSDIDWQINSRADCKVYRIPTVVHVFYDDATSNISDEQIQSQIEVLNQDFRRLWGTPGFGEGVDTRIEFCLATKAPDGSPTNGITRTGSTFTNHKSSEELLLKNQTQWDDSKYLNIWVVKSITWIDPDNPGENEEILGYATFPGGPINIPQGVVISGKYFGTTGTAKAPYNLGRTCTHEVGHYLGLLHPFEDDSTCQGFNANNCISQGDFVCDTPAEQYPTYGCPSQSVNSCDDRPCDTTDPLSNYMNFTDDVCMNHFTEGQKARMEFFLNSVRANLHSANNLATTGCDPIPEWESIPAARFSASITSTCANNSIFFSDQSLGCVGNRSWFFQGGLPQTSTDENPIITYPQSGNYEVQLIVSNGAGADTLTKSNWIHIPEPASLPPLVESFESVGFIPEDWFVADEDLDGSWVRTQLAALDGQSSAVAFHRNLNSCNSYEGLLTRMIDLSQVSSANLFFSYAYQAANSDPFDADKLIVEVSTDCGESYNPIFEAAGTALATVSIQQNNFPFIPQNSADWKTVQIGLNEYVGENQVMLRFHTLGLNGQNLFLDDILLDANVGIEPDLAGFSYVNIGPNPFTDRLEVHFSLIQYANLTIELMDLQGKHIYRSEPSYLTVGNHTLQLVDAPIRQLPAGMYLLRLKTDTGILDQKIIKHRF